MYKRLIISIFTVFTLDCTAQNFLGLQSSNWAGVNFMYSNPAGLADGRHRQHVNASCFGFSTSTNALRLETPFTFMQLVRNKVPSQYKNSSGQIAWNSSWFKQDNSNSKKYLHANLEWRGPSIMTRLGKKNAVGFSMRTKFNFSINNVDQKLIDFAISSIDSGSNAVRSINNNSFTINSHAYQEVAGSFARVLINKESAYLKVGLTGKYLMGIASANITNRGIDAELSASDDTLFINSSDVEIAHSNVDYLDKFSNNGIGSFLLPSFRNINGSGLGFDVGAIFEWRPRLTDPITSNNRYLFKAGMSLLDIGSISMKQDLTKYSASNLNRVTFAADSAFANAFAQSTDSGLSYLRSYAENNLNYKEGSSSYLINLPMTLSIQLDYNVFKWLYIGANWNQSLISKKAIAFRRPSSLSLIPRLETRGLEIAMPVLVYDDYKQFGLGFFTRIGPVYLGSDNLINSLSGNSINGLDFYFGVSTGISAKRSKKKKRRKEKRVNSLPE